ncbi:hypothetical protein ONZ45_g12871 [Pleurotus djamor]|nr:hypothetical protein ONZ45_g12871 [Pleurotus djamor]
MPPIPSLDEGSFTLDVSGIVGFLGGDEAISATESVHFYEHRKYLGFYNTPGSYKVAKHYGKLARGQVWDALYPGVNEEPAAFLKLDGKSGPSYRGIMSGTAISDIGHVGHVFEQLCDDLPVQHPTKSPSLNPISVTVVDLKEVRKDAPNRVSISYPATFSSSPWRYIVAFLTCVLNLAICILSALCDEWFAFSLILLGIICNGLACFLIGSARIYLKYHKPSQHSPLGNGIIAEKKHFIVLTGSEEAVNQIVKGSFEVDFGNDASYSRIGSSLPHNVASSARSSSLRH